MKKIKLVSVVMLCGLVMSTCSSNNDGMQGKVVGKDHFNSQVAMGTVKMVPLFTHVGGGHVSTGGHVSVDHATGGRTTTHVTTEHATALMITRR